MQRLCKRQRMEIIRGTERERDGARDKGWKEWEEQSKRQKWSEKQIERTRGASEREMDWETNNRENERTERMRWSERQRREWEGQKESKMEWAERDSDGVKDKEKREAKGKRKRETWRRRERLERQRSQVSIRHTVWQWWPFASITTKHRQASLTSLV